MEVWLEIKQVVPIEKSGICNQLTLNKTKQNKTNVYSATKDSLIFGISKNVPTRQDHSLFQRFLGPSGRWTKTYKRNRARADIVQFFGFLGHG